MLLTRWARALERRSSCGRGRAGARAPERAGSSSGEWEAEEEKLKEKMIVCLKGQNNGRKLLTGMGSGSVITLGLRRRAPARRARSFFLIASAWSRYKALATRNTSREVVAMFSFIVLKVALLGIVRCLMIGSVCGQRRHTQTAHNTHTMQIEESGRCRRRRRRHKDRIDCEV